MTQPYLFALPTHGAEADGWLTVADAPGLPFTVRRVFWVTDVPPGRVRGRHAHRSLEQVLVAVSGVVRLRLRPAEATVTLDFCLDRPERALYLPPGCWSEIRFEPGAVLLCLASQPYDPADYLHE